MEVGTCVVFATEDDLNEVKSSIESVDTPKLYWEGSMPATKAEGAMNGVMRFESGTKSVILYASIKVQGDSSAYYPKKNYTITFYTDETYTDKLKVEFNGLGKHSSYVIKAHWIDHSHIRNISAMKIWREMMETREDFESLPEEIKTSYGHGASAGFSLRFYANGLYWGLYEMIIVKKEIFGQSKSNPLHSLLNSDWNNKKVCTFDTLTPNLSEGWTEELQDDFPATTTVSFGNLIKLIARDDNDEILANLPNLLDIDSAIDYDIFARIFTLRDNLAKNQIFATYDGEKWYEGAWDMDATAGCPPTTNGSFCEYNIVFQEEYEAYRAFQLLNKLYVKIEELYLERFKSRYNSLRRNVLTVSNIINTYEKYNDRVAQWLDEDYASTTGDGAFTGVPFKNVNNIQQIRSFMSKRLTYMDDVINAMSRVVADPTVSVGFSTATMSCLTAGATIYYTMDGTEPTSASTEYTGAINYTDGDVLKMIAIKEGYDDSNVVTETLECPYAILQSVTQNGQSYFLSDYIPNSATSVEYKIEYGADSMSYSWGVHFLSCSDSKTSNNIFFSPILRTRGKTDGTAEMFCRIGTSEYTQMTTWASGVPYTFKYENGEVSINDTVLKTGVTGSTFPTTANFCVLGYAINNVLEDSNNNCKNVTVYYMKIFENGTLVREYVPVFKRETSEYGLFETVTNTFNTGNRGFVADNASITNLS